MMQFIQGLAQTLQADPNEIIRVAQQNPDALKAAVQVFSQTKDMNQAAQVFSQALQQQVAYLYQHVVWSSDGGDEPEPTGSIYIGSSMATTKAEVDVTGFTDITTDAVRTMDDTSSAGATFRTPAAGYVWIVVPESYNVVSIFAKTGSLPGYETQLYRDEGTLNGLHYWSNGPEDEERISAGQECTIVLLTH